MHTHYYHYNYGISNDFATGIFAGFIAFFAVVFMIALVIIILKIIGVWKILKKAGQPAWGALIPIYNQYLLCKITGVNPWWILIVCLSPILIIIPILGYLASVAISLYFVILLNVSLARSFGKDDSFAVGLILLSPIFNLILGLGDSKYLGEKPMNDVILNKVENINAKTSSYTNQKEQDSNDHEKYCSSCGSKINEYTRFCPNCGKEIR